jgi:soluble lytic murein transglycosylase
LLAEDELGDVLTATPINYVPTESEVQQIQNQPAIQRVLELQRIGLKWESRSEWSWATRDYDDKQLLAAAELALRQGWYDVAINTAERTKSVHSYTLRFPTPYRETVTNFSKDYGVDEAWVYGLTRQESRFNPSAKSGVGAAGVMQVMPETAAWIAKRMNLGGYRQDKIHQLDTNVQLGTYYLRYTLDMMNGQTPLATAAYNAGPGRVKNWMADQPIEGAIYVENIPILETRAYVQKVMANTYFYAYRLGTKTQSLKQRLGIITKTSAAIAAE